MKLLKVKKVSYKDKCGIYSFFFFKWKIIKLSFWIDKMDYKCMCWFISLNKVFIMEKYINLLEY